MINNFGLKAHHVVSIYNILNEESKENFHKNYIDISDIINTTTPHITNITVYYCV